MIAHLLQPATQITNIESRGSAAYPKVTKKDFMAGVVLYTAGRAFPSKFNEGQMDSNIVVTTAHGEIKVWGEINLLKTLHKGRTVLLEKSPRAKNWKLAVDPQTGQVIEGHQSQQSTAPAQQAQVSVAPQQQRPATGNAIASEISAMAALYTDCYKAAQRNLGAIAPAETIQAAASSVFIQLNKNHDSDTLFGTAAEGAKADLGF